MHPLHPTTLEYILRHIYYIYCYILRHILYIYILYVYIVHIVVAVRLSCSLLVATQIPGHAAPLKYVRCILIPTRLLHQSMYSPVRPTSVCCMYVLL